MRPLLGILYLRFLIQNIVLNIVLNRARYKLVRVFIISFALTTVDIDVVGIIFFYNYFNDVTAYKNTVLYIIRWAMPHVTVTILLYILYFSSIPILIVVFIFQRKIPESF